MSSFLNGAGWVCFLLAVKNFLGIGAAGSDSEMVSAMLGEILPIPDVKTIVFAALAVGLGFLARDIDRHNGNPVKRGGKVMICGILCIVLSFTPLSLISTFSTMMAYQNRQLSADGFVDIPESDYTLYAFLGSGDSHPSDVDVMEYIIDGYDGHARDVYDSYKVTGWLFHENGPAWYDLDLALCLVDEEGNDILSDGQPVILHYSYSNVSNKNDQGSNPEGGSSFQTSTVKAKDLSGTPYGFRIEHIQRGYYIDHSDGSQHDEPIYN